MYLVKQLNFSNNVIYLYRSQCYICHFVQFINAALYLSIRINLIFKSEISEVNICYRSMCVHSSGNDNLCSSVKTVT